MIRAGAGLSTDPDPCRAAGEAIDEAREQLDGACPDWLLAFASVSSPGDPTDMLAALSEAAGTPYVIGCSAAGVLANGREVEGVPAIGVLAVRSDRLRATPFLFRDGDDHGLTAGIRLGQRLMGSRGTNDLVLVWPDPLHVRPDRLLMGLAATLGGVPVAGGAAASLSPGADTLQFCGSEAVTAAVSGVRLGGEFRHRVAVSQGCRPLGAPLRVTRSHENLILEIEGRSPLDVLRELVPEGVLDEPALLPHQLFVGLLPDPQEMLVREGEYLVRNVLALDSDAGVIAIADVVEEGQSIIFAQREPRAAQDDLERMLGRVTAGAGNPEYRFALYFNCLARGRSLYRQEGVDSAMIRRALPGVPVLGFFGNAEIAPLRGVNQLLTYTGVIVLVSE